MKAENKGAGDGLQKAIKTQEKGKLTFSNASTYQKKLHILALQEIC